MKNNNLRYQEYKQYVDEEWKEGNVNELEEGGWIAIKSVILYNKGSINYRYLTKEELYDKLLHEDKSDESNDSLTTKSSNNNWISTKDRLPENNNDYLIIHRKFNRPETDIIEVFSYENNEWWDDGYKFKTNPDYRTVVYWMPLPEKPKE